ncbi:MAG: hypothetical protein JWL62_146 [Hyphomicrobiales bacterium]|nr:hypothetical protein [Hyphomicrobiales bacterium]
MRAQDLLCSVQGSKKLDVGTVKLSKRADKKLEGTVSMHTGSKYRSGRSVDWLKTRTPHSNVAESTHLINLAIGPLTA